MAIRIPILTSFDPKGLKQANTAFANLQTSIGSVAKNFAIAGAGIAAGTALLGRAVMSASNFEAEFEGVNQIFKEAAGSVQAFAETAAQTAGISATEALKAAKSFGSFATGIGLSVDEAANFSTSLVQLAGDLGSFNDLPTADALAAIQSGLMGQAEPLRNFSVFLDDLTLKQALFNATGEKVTGTLTTQQKMIAAYSSIFEQTQVQQGDFVKYQETLGNQLKSVGAEFQNLTRDIGMILIPVITEAMPYIRQMGIELGARLKAAIESVDWKSLTTTIVNLAGFFVENAENIAKLITAIFLLNTAFKLMTVASGLATVAIKLQDWFTAKLTTGMTLATVATTLLSAAMRLIPFVAIAGGLALIVNGIMNIDKEAGNAQHNVRILNGEITTGGEAAWESANKYEKIGGAFKLVETAADNAALAIEAFNKPSDSESRNRRNALRDENRRLGKIGSTGIASALPDFSSLLSAAEDASAAASAAAVASDSGPTGIHAWLANYQKEADLAAKRVELIGKGLSEAVTDSLLSASDPLGAANDALFLIATGGLANINMLTDAFNRSAAGQAFAAEQARKIAEEAQRVAEEAAAREQALLDKRMNAFESFNNSVKSLFGQIKNSILSSFDLPTLGNSVNSITRNIGKLLEKTKSFASNISQLSGMGLNSALLQQVIQAGPLAGSALASALVGGGGGFIGQLNQAYGEFGDLASGIAATGTRSAFDNPSVVNTYNIEVNGGVGSGPTIGKAIVDAIKSYERTSGAVWQGA
jgi:hypothetical protein